MAEFPRPPLLPLEERMDRGDRCAHEGSQLLILGLPPLGMGYTLITVVLLAAGLLGLALPLRSDTFPATSNILSENRE